MFTIRTIKKVYQRVRSIEKARRILHAGRTEHGKRIPSSAYIDYGTVDKQRYRKSNPRPVQTKPLGLYLQGHVI